ncbi:hypothetical protein [Actinoplanes awajinensis]|uniref:Lipoprotein n=1 Tax=Actinoplanes awajinensis subsp. mycoplanecinus TaxID=135947 RepID=A0A0X3UPL4_9ACTN|nr:hypothetical protein [Actinoplanes awajinensis]KUL34531.1 hypothetical protein ADL15_15770 [Actinoplanes awajinensis subsp. mycoplanecinus]
MSDLQKAMHDWADRMPAGEPPIAELVGAGTRSRIRRRVGAAGTATLALAAVVGVALSTGGTTPSGSTEAAGPVATPVSPALELAAAATSTAESSFAFKIASTLTLAEWQIDHVTTTCTGALDPANNTGYVSGGLFETRLVDGHSYVRKDTLWVDRGKGTLAGSMLCGDSKAPAAISANPATALKSLQKAGDVTKTAGGYTFTADEVRGKVKVAGGKITEFTYTINSKVTKDYPAYTRETTMTFGSYGKAVSVKKPL